MDYASPAFFFFAAAGLICFYSVPLRYRYGILLTASIIWLCSWKPIWAGVYLSTQFTNYLCLRFIPRCHIVLISANLAVFILLKLSLLLPSESATFGLSFFLLMILGLVIDHWRRPEEKPDWKVFSLMPVFFPLMMAGPVMKGRHFSSELRKPTSGILTVFSEGILIFSSGLVRNYFLLPPFELLYREMLRSIGSPLSIFLVGFLSTTIVYLELSSYALMGRGIARCFGVEVPLSFRPFYLASDPVDFWRRWNMSLGNWIWDYFTLPALLRFGRKVPRSLIVFFAFLLVGLWHGIEERWFIFGAYNGMVVIFFTAYAKRASTKIVGKILSFILICGNGYLLSPGVEIVSASFFSPALTFWEATRNSFSSWGILILLCLLLVEWKEERSGDQDWFLKLPLKAKLTLSTVLILLYVWALKVDAFQMKTQIKLPEYFKL